MPRPAQQMGVVGQINRLKISVGQSRFPGAVQLQSCRQLDSSSKRPINIGGGSRENREVVDNQVMISGVEPCGAQRSAASGKIEVNACVPAPCVFRLESGIALKIRVCAEAFEEARRAEPRAKTGPQLDPSRQRQPGGREPPGGCVAETVMAIAAQSGRQEHTFRRRPFVIGKKREQVVLPVDVTKAIVPGLIPFGREPRGQPVLFAKRQSILPVELGPAVQHIGGLRRLPGCRVFRDKPPILPSQGDPARPDWRDRIL